MTRPPHASWTRWLPWIFGFAILVTVVAVAAHASEWQAFLRLLSHARPGWLLLAAVLQALTYLAQGEVFRAPARAGGYRIRLRLVYKLSFVKLFIDQALPSIGISSTLFIAKALAQYKVPKHVASASMVLNFVSYNVAYVVCLVAALWSAAAAGYTNGVVLACSILFLLCAGGVTVLLIEISAGRARKAATFLKRLPLIRNLVEFLAAADSDLTRNARLLVVTSCWQAVIILLDAATMWGLIFSLGAHASFAGVYASFMIANLVRTMGFLPGGLGTFEATSVLTLKMVGVSIPVALSATLLFRGLSFWLPMLPGLWISRKIASADPVTDPHVERLRTSEGTA